MSEVDKAEGKKMGYTGSKPGKKRDSDSWFTPTKYVESARIALGGHIDLDPFSSEKANIVVKAKNIFTKDKSAFDFQWPTVQTCFMNPPYGAGICGKAIEEFVRNYRDHRFDKGIILVNNATDTKWFHKAMEDCWGFCFTDHRIGFYNSDGKAISTNTRGQVFLFYGRRYGFIRFAKEFQQHGRVCEINRMGKE